MSPCDSGNDTMTDYRLIAGSGARKSKQAEARIPANLAFTRRFLDPLKRNVAGVEMQNAGPSETGLHYFKLTALMLVQIPQLGGH